MHFHTPHMSKKSEKRKASLDSVVGDDDIALGKKVTRSKSKPKPKKKAKTTTKHDNMRTAEDAHTQRQTSLSLSPSRSASIPSSRKDSAQELPVEHTNTTTTNAQTQTDPDTPTPRRSSRIKNSMNSVANTWTKCRPYIERINGTIMPLEPQGTKAYYARDGVKVD